VNESIEQVLKNIKISQMQEEPEVLDLTAQETAVRGTNGPDPKKATELVTIST
jgi:hypothetical protein